MNWIQKIVMLSEAKHLWLLLTRWQADDQRFFVALRMTENR
jgi:hypothetical protein